MIALVREKATELGYVPSVAGRALRTGRSGVIGLVLADIAHPLFPQIAQAIENVAAGFGYGVLIGDSRGDVGAQTSAINRLLERGADGLVIVPRRATRIGDIGKPVAVIDAVSTPGNTVCADHWGGGRTIARHLRDLGHRRFALIGANSDSNVQNDRIGGLKSGLSDADSNVTIWIDDCEERYGKGCTLGAADLVRQGVTAFAAVSDLHALRVLTELQRAGIHVPDEASVTGFDDLIWANAIAPSLTTMRADMPRIAMIAVTDLVEQIEAGEAARPAPASRQHPGVAMELVMRQSSGPVPGRKPHAIHESAFADALSPLQTTNHNRRKA